MSKIAPSLTVYTQNIVACECPICQKNIEQVSKVKNIRIIFNHTLTRTDHIITASGKVFGMLRTLYKIRIYTPQHILSLLVKTFLATVLLNRCESISKCDHRSKNRIESTYNAIISYVYGVKKFQNCLFFLKNLFGVNF